MMQRLFSTFPSAWPGFGLLLLRVATGFYLLSDATKGGFTVLADGSLHGLEMVMGILLLIGCWTPVAALAQSAFLLYDVFADESIDAGHVMRLVVGVSLAMVGPGSMSLDSRFFGRKRIEVLLPDNE